MGKCTFKEEWLRKKDDNGYIISEWARQKNAEVFCTVCTKSFFITWGFKALEQHASTNKHKDGCKIVLSTSQMHLSTIRPVLEHNSGSSSSMATSNPAPVQLFSNRDSATRAELVWIMKCIMADFPIQPACDNIINTFECMFPNAVPRDFSLSRTKAHYLTTEALAPYFRKMLLKDIGTSYFTLCYDETTNSASYKELQIAIRYWSSSKNNVCTRHLQTFFLGSATAKILFRKIDEALDESDLSLSKLLMLSNDGPNVNKAVTKLMNDYLILSRKKRMIDIGTCNIHTVHNAFRKGMAELGEDASQLILLIYDFFDGWPSRWSDFEKLQSELKVKEHRFVKHVQSRWLTLENAAQRLLEQWPVVIKYFTNFVPKFKTDVSKSIKYKSIMALLDDKTIKAEILFVIMSAKLFTKFTALFQREEPLVHMLYTELEGLTKSIMNRVCSLSAPFSIEAFSYEHYLPLPEIITDPTINEEIAQLSENNRKIFLTSARKHFVVAAKYLLQESALIKPILKNLKCLSPLQSLKEKSHKDIVKIAEVLPMNIPLDLLADEWKLLRFEKESNDKSQVVEYWNSVFQVKKASGDAKYPLVTQVVQAALSLSHGSASVERGFSRSGRILTDKRANMEERTLNAHLIIKETLKNVYENRVDFVTINQDLLEMARKAHVNYKHYCEEQEKIKEKELKERELKEQEEKIEQKRLEEMDKTRNKIQIQEEKLKLLRNEEAEKRKVVQTLLSDVTNNIKEAAASKDLTRLNVAQIMLEGVEKAFKDESQSKKEADAVQKTIEKRKKTLITSFFSKKPKTE